MLRALRGLSTVLIAAGVLLLIDAGVTLAWQEPISALLAQRQQDKLSHQLGRIELAKPTPVEQRALRSLGTDNRRRIAFLARVARRKAKEGQPIGKIHIPKIGANFVVVEGTNQPDLQKGPGHYPSTAYPGLGETVGIAGHRTTYLAPFRNVNDLEPGDRIVLDMPYARFTYAVQKTQIVTPDSTWVVNDVGYERLVLSACNPLYSAAQRIIIFARLASEQPRGAAR